MCRAFVLSCVMILPILVFGQEAKVTRPTISGISHITLFADYLTKSQEFYSALLGWEQAPEGAPHSGVRFYANHLQYIELLSPPRKDLADRLDSIGFSTADAEALRRYLAANGVTVPQAVTVDKDGDRFFAVRDPEGNKIEFTQAGPRAPKGGKSASDQASTHIIHAGFVARDRAALDRFYKDLLGFHLYWQGGSSPDQTEWVMMQVPDGTDWLEYMLRLPASPSRGELGTANHFSPGVVSVAELEKKLKQRGWTPSAQERPPLLGLDGKWQLDLFDPDGTRVEFMEFLPAKEPCCAPYTGRQPSPSPAW
jgi:catechol 2,3-dioxygenase-like lactoylglutathione lyase family enzyme